MHSSTKPFSLEMEDVTDTVVLTADNIRSNILNGCQVFNFLEEVGLKYHNVFYYSAAGY
jgi:hypothetical protein